MIPVTAYYVLTIVLFFANAEPQSITGMTPDRTACETEEGNLLTQADKSDKVLGWVITDECTKVAPAKKA